MPGGHLRKPPQVCGTRCMPAVQQRLLLECVSPNQQHPHLQHAQSLADPRCGALLQAPPWCGVLGCEEREGMGTASPQALFVNAGMEKDACIPPLLSRAGTS